MSVNIKVDYTGKTAVIYVRYSSGNQHIESAEAQILACEKWAKENGVKIIYIYKDLEKSGTNTKNRPEFNRMIKDSEKGMFDIVLAHKIDRFARSQNDFFKNEIKLAENGVELITVDQIFGNSPYGKVVKSVMVTMAEIFSSNLSNEIKVKNREYAKKGLFMGGIVPYGYKVKTIIDNDGRERKVYSIVEEESKIINMIFDMFISGYSIGSINEYLYKEGYRNKKGKPFPKSTIRDILNNDMYIGTYTYSKNQDDEIIIENNHDLIVTTEKWNKVKAIQKDNRPKPRKNKSNDLFLLTGLMKCEYCGLSVISRGAGNEKYKYYGCSSGRNHHKNFCLNKKTIRKEELENTVLDLVKDHFFTDEMLELYVDLVLNNLINNSEDAKHINDLKERKKELLEQEQRLIQLFTSKIKFNLAAIEKEQEEINSELEIIEKKLTGYEMSNKTYTREEVMEYLNKIKQNMRAIDENELIVLLRKAISHIIVGHNKIDIYFNIFNPYPDDMGYANDNFCSKEQSPLPNRSLEQKNISVYKLESGVYLGHFVINK